MVRRLGGAFAALVLLGLSLSAAPAAADTCRMTCTAAKKVCVTAGMQALKACRQDCIAAGATGDCRTACRADFADARATCKAALADCRAACQPEPPPPCQGDCVAQGRACIKTVADTAVSCGSTCLSDAHAAGAACKTAPQPLLCFFQVAGQTASCLRTCAATAKSGAQTCVDGVQSCTHACGSPSGAFVD